MSKASHVYEWNPERQRMEWRRLSDGTPEEPRTSPNRLEPGARANVSVGARPKRGEKCFKPSDALLRSLNNTQRDAERRAYEERIAALEQRMRDIDAGRVVVDPTATLATPVVRVEDGEKTHYIRADRADESVKARSEQQRENREEAARKKQAIDIAAKIKERKQVAASLSAVGAPQPAPGIFLTEDASMPALPAMPDASTRGIDQVAFTQWTPQRNPGRAFL